MSKPLIKKAGTEGKSWNKRGIVMFIVLATVLVVILLANILLGLVSSQSRLTHHQVSRIQAYYAARAGVNYAIEQLRLGNWHGGETAGLCRSFPGPGCTNPPSPDSTLPASIQLVSITVGNPGEGINGTIPITATATYTYSP